MALCLMVIYRYLIKKQSNKAKDIATGGNSIHEFGYDPTEK